MKGKEKFIFLKTVFAAEIKTDEKKMWKTRKSSFFSWIYFPPLVLLIFHFLIHFAAVYKLVWLRTLTLD